MQYRIIIAGSRDFTDYRLLCEEVDLLIDRIKDSDCSALFRIISGGARGADALGERYARERGISLRTMPPDWATLGKRAGYVRNEEMARVATHCICFWDGVSSGTKHMIDIAKRQGLDVHVVRQQTYR